MKKSNFKSMFDVASSSKSIFLFYKSTLTNSMSYFYPKLYNLKTILFLEKNYIKNGLFFKILINF